MRWFAATVPDLGLPALDDAALAAVLPDLCHGLRSLDDVATADWLAALHALVGHARLAEIDRLAPAALELAGGRRQKLMYAPGRAPCARGPDPGSLRRARDAVRGRRPHARRRASARPNHRPQQVTSDLASFWQNTYPVVKKELRRRYPKHAWPDDPLAAPPRCHR